MVMHRMLAPINSIKHYQHRTNTTVGTGGVSLQNVVNALAKGAARTDPGHCEEGCIIKAIHLEYWLCGTLDGTTSQFTFIAFKLPSGQDSPTAAEMANLGGWENKKNILFSSQGVLPEGESQQSIPVIRDWLKIPKGKQRFGLGDIFQVAMHSVGTLQFCGLATYKEYE